MPFYLDEISGTPRKEQGSECFPMPVGQGPGPEIGIHISIILLSSLPWAPTPSHGAALTVPGTLLLPWMTV